MFEDYSAMVRRWSDELTADAKASDDPMVRDDAVDYPRLRNLIEYLDKRLFEEYKPTKAPRSKQFLDRLNDWLNSASDDADRKVLFELVTHILFVGSHEFDSLYQAAFDGPIARWIIDLLGVKVDDPNISQHLEKAVSETWFCAITDSMQISEFYHLNRIEGASIRPVWRTLHMLQTSDSITKIGAYMQKENYKRLVLLEDFVGSGTQMSSAVRFASQLPSTPDVLLCPMIICSRGVERARKLQADLPNVTYAPVLELPPNACLSPTALDGEDGFLPRLRATVLNIDKRSRIGTFGFKSTGAMVVMHTNCPNNTIPIIRRDSQSGATWSPLFPRSERN